MHVNLSFTKGIARLSFPDQEGFLLLSEDDSNKLLALKKAVVEWVTVVTISEGDDPDFEVRILVKSPDKKRAVEIFCELDDQDNRSRDWDSDEFTNLLEHEGIAFRFDRD